MSALDERVRELLGASEPARWEPDPSLARIAGEVERRGIRTLGLVPASKGVELGAVGLRLAFARAHLGGEPVALVDLAGEWPLPRTRRPGGRAFVSRELSDRVVLVTRSDPSRARLFEALRDVLALLEPPGRAVLDLGAPTRTGEHVELASLLDGVSVVARAGVTRAAELERRVGELGERSAGVLLLE